MSKKLRDTKSAQLGMPISTASSRLRKMILFSLLQKYDEDICFRCGDQIVEINELSIDHKDPWLNVSVDLFWDLNNIAFSHHGCNSAAGDGSAGGNATAARIKSDPEFARRHREWSSRGGVNSRP